MAKTEGTVARGGSIVEVTEVDTTRAIILLHELPALGSRIIMTTIMITFLNGDYILPLTVYNSGRKEV